MLNVLARKADWHKALIATIAFLVLSIPAFAQQDEVFDIGEVVIFATAPERMPWRDTLPVTTTVIDRATFANRTVTVPDLLRETAGVEIKRYGGLGSFSTVSIRGSESGQVVVMIDGVPLNTAAGGAVDTGSIPVDNVERIEIFRGNVPLRYGASAPGGVINIVTKQPAKGRRASASVRAGSFGFTSLNVFSALEKNRKSFSIGVDREHSDGDFKFLDDNGTPLNTADDEVTTRKNNGFSSTNIDFKFKLIPRAGRTLVASSQMFQKNQGIPGLGSFQSRSARLKTERGILTLAVEDLGVAMRRVNSRYRLSRSVLRSKFSDPAGEIGLSTRDNRNTTRADSFRTEHEFRTGSHSISAATGYSVETFRPFDALQILQAGKPSRRNSWFVEAEDKIEAAGGRLLIIPAMRHERVVSRFSGNDPFNFSPLAPESKVSRRFTALRAGARFSASNDLVLKANQGRYLRIPSFYELFGDMGSAIGNSKLLPETGRNRDFGLVYDFSRRSGMARVFEASYFRNVSDNTIIFMQNSQRASRPDNAGRGIVRGFEASLLMDVAPRWSLSSNFTYQNARDDSSVAYWRGNSLPGRHERELSARLTHKTNSFRSWYDFSTASGSFLDRANLYPVSAASVHGAGVAFTREKVTCSIEVKNISDNRVSDVMGYPLPGRMWFFGVNWGED